MSTKAAYPKFTALTPDEDHYIHDAEVDLSDIEDLGPRGGVPHKVRQSQHLVYRFGHGYSDNELRRVIDEGQEIILQARKLMSSC